MSEQVGKRFQNDRSSLLDIVRQPTADKSSTGDTLDFSKGFTYQSQDLNDVHPSADELNKLSNERLNKFLGGEISNEEMTDKEIETFTKGLTNQQLRWINTVGSGFSTNGIVAYINRWNEWKNPFASGTGMFERKDGKDASQVISEGDSFDRSAKSIPGAIGRGTIGLGGLELGGRGLYKWGDSIYRGAIKPTDKDVETLVREDANSKKYKYHNNRAEQIKKEMDKLVEGDPKRDELNKQYENEIASRDRYAPREKSTTVDLMDEAGVTGDNFNIASDTDFQAEKHWTEKVKPYMDKSESKFLKSDFIDKLTRDLFKDVDDYTWQKQYAPVIEEMKEVYGGQGEISLNELHEWKKQFQPSKNLLAGDTAQTTMKNINDKMYSMLTKEIKDTLDKENPGKKAGKAYSDYGKWIEAADESLGKAQSELTKETKRTRGVKKWIKKKIDKLLGKPFKTKSGQILKKIGKAITPSQWVSGGKAGAGVIDVVGIVQLLRLVPGTIGELATQFIEGTPAGVADEELWDSTIGNSVNQWSWNSKSDDERIDYLKENLDSLYGIEFPRDDIEYSYYKWKGNSDGNLEIKMGEDGGYFAGGENDEALPVFVSNEEKDRERENERLNETVYKILYMNAESDDLRIKLIMDRYSVSEDRAKEMLKNMTAGGEYNNPNKFTGLKPGTVPA